MTGNENRFKSSSARDAEEARLREVGAVQLWRLGEWFPTLGTQTHALLRAYFEELAKFNKTINLVSPRTIASADLVHFADCILGWQLIVKAAPAMKEIVDIGSGNGFPGAIGAILSPGIKIVALDSDKRKCEFLKATAAKLNIANLSVQSTNVEAVGEKSIQFAVSRGFAPLSKAILNTRRVFTKGGSYFHLKSEEWASEIASIPTQLCSFWLPSLVGEYKLPMGEVKYAVVKTEKIAD